MTDGPSRKHHHSFAWLPYSGEAEKEVSLINDDECTTEGCNIKAVLKDACTSSETSITTLQKQNDGAFKERLSSDAVNLQTKPLSNAKS